MLKNINKLADFIGTVADDLSEVATINLDSVKELSHAGNKKAHQFHKAAEYDVKAQDIELQQKLDALATKPKKK